MSTRLAPRFTVRRYNCFRFRLRVTPTGQEYRELDGFDLGFTRAREALDTRVFAASLSF